MKLIKIFLIVDKFNQWYNISIVKNIQRTYDYVFDKISHIFSSHTFSLTRRFWLYKFIQCNTKCSLHHKSLHSRFDFKLFSFQEIQGYFFPSDSRIYNAFFSLDISFGKDYWIVSETSVWALKLINDSWTYHRKAEHFFITSSIYHDI